MSGANAASVSGRFSLLLGDCSREFASGWATFVSGAVFGGLAQSFSWTAGTKRSPTPQVSLTANCTGESRMNPTW